MNPLLLTITFLTLMALLTSSEMRHLTEEHLKEQGHAAYLAREHQRKEATARATFEELKEAAGPQTPPDPIGERGINPPSQPASGPKGKSAPLNYDATRPPNNSRFNLYLMLFSDHPKAHPFYEATAALIRQLYGGFPFFQEIANAEYILLNKLIEQREEARDFFFADELGSLDFNDPPLQRLFFQLLKGNNTAPSLLHYISFDKEKKKKKTGLVNLMFSPKEVVYALVQNRAQAEQALAIRAALWEEIEEQEKNRKTLPKTKGREEFKEALKTSLRAIFSEEEIRLFDLSLGKKGSIIFVRDPFTGVVARERVMKKRL